MNKPPRFLSGWDSELAIQLDTENNDCADFNRFLYRGFPTTDQLKQSRKFKCANRKEAIIKIKSRFIELISEGKSQTTLATIFKLCSQYLRWCDERNGIAFTKASLEGYMQYLHSRVMLGEIKRTTYQSRASYMHVLFTEYLDLPHAYFNNVTILNKSDTESYEAYTRSDLNQLLPFLRSLFKQTYQQFIKSPQKHIHSYKNQHTMIFHWKGSDYKLCGGISKMMCAGTFLLSYYTYANKGDLLQLKQPKNASMTSGEVWYKMPAFKRRAFKTIQIEVGENSIDIPKYAMDFFDNLLCASRLISKNEDPFLLQTVTNKKATRIKSSTLNAFLNNWLERHFNFFDLRGRKLRPIISRFRETGSQITAYYQGDTVNNIMLNNTLKTRRKHYSHGNTLSNNSMIQDAMTIREEQVKSGESIQESICNLGISVLVIDEEFKSNLPDLGRTPSGSSCAAPFNDKANKYTLNAIKHRLASTGERLACADLLGCFGCPHQVIVQSLNDIWCLLSFKACIEESLYLHLDASHYRKNFDDIVKFIETMIIPNLNTKLLKQAEEKLNNDGCHPLWVDADSVLSLSSTFYPLRG